MGARAGDYLMQLEYAAPTVVIGAPEPKPANFWERFELAYMQRAESVFTYRFHSLSTMQWHFGLGEFPAADYRERTSLVARQAFTRSVVTAAREAALGLPFMIWLDEQRGFLTDLVLNSLDNDEEAAITPLSPAYRELERSWWKRLSESRDYRYGIRPFQTSPYVFVSKGFWKGDSLLVLADLRYHYRNFADHQFELALSMPLTHGLAVDVGTAYQFGRHADIKQMTLKLSKQFAKGGMLHVGMTVQARPTFLVGMSLPL
jgi:hypothetical protein